MFDLDLDFQNDDEAQSLQEFLVSTLGHVRSLHATLTALLTDVAALRRTMLGEPEDLERYETNLKLAMATAKPLVDEAMRSYDEMIQALSVTGRWKN